MLYMYLWVSYLTVKEKASGFDSGGFERGTKRNRTAVAGFADLCLTTRP